MKNPSASIRARLMNLAKEQGLSFQLILIRYLQERLLFRLSKSNFRNNFYLKGGALIYAYEGSKTRFTLDIDLLGKNIENSREAIENAFSEILSIEYNDDGVWFDPSTIQTELIAEQDKYNGIRLFVEAGFHTVKQRLQVDIGFGDVLQPNPNNNLDFPVLLPGSEVPVIQAYASETIIAEKFQAMIELSSANSRMKDFYDVYKLISNTTINQIKLELAIKATFKNRNTPYTESHALFNGNFFTDSSRERMWKAFLNKIGQDKHLKLLEVGNTILNTLKPIWERLRV
mgnify:CR=1 FL=1